MWCCLQTDISECHDPATNLKQLLGGKRKKKEKSQEKVQDHNLLAYQWKPQFNMWIIHYAHCVKISYFWGHTLPVSQTSWLIGTNFQALCWYNREIQFHREQWSFQVSQNAKLYLRTKATEVKHTQAPTLKPCHPICSFVYVIGSTHTLLSNFLALPVHPFIL